MIGFLAAIVLVCIQNCVAESSFKIFLNLLYSMACGALIGDALVHILP